MNRPIDKYQVDLEKHCGGVGNRIKETGGVKDTTRKPPESTNLGPWWCLTESEPPTKEYA